MVTEISNSPLPSASPAKKRKKLSRGERAAKRLLWHIEEQELANAIADSQRKLAGALLARAKDLGYEEVDDDEEIFQVQSALLVEKEGGSGVVQQENIAFVDEVSGLKVGIDEPYDGVSAADQTSNTTLNDFLRRPVRIATFTWAEADAIGTTRTFAPWHLFFNDDRIKYKLNNFAFIQAKLKIKVLINASPFYFGAMIGSYIPNIGFTPSTIVNDAATRWFIPLSQRPHMWIYPQSSKGDEITLPFFYHKNFLNIQSAADLTNMGSISFVNYTELDSANGAVGVGVSVQVYAWAEDVKLSGPSVGLAMQGDEYGMGVISTPATAIANSARWFENVPVIGRFATATRIGANAVSAIASLFGFTNVPNVNNCEAVRPSPFPQLATTSISYPSEKLTVDPKNELSIDPSILGLSSEDEMIISNLVQKESYLTTAVWSNTNSVDDILFSSRVTPALYDNDAAAEAKVYMTPLAWISQAFKGWRGDLIFRFKFVASPFHKGRVRVSYDPAGYAAKNIIVDDTSETVVMTQIIDLGQESDVEIRLPYQQATAFLQNLNSFSVANIAWSTDLAPAFGYNPIFDNGTITMRVQTNLTAPVAVTSVPILIFVRGAENLEFANPCNVGDLSIFPVQSETVYGNPMEMTSGKNSSVNDDRYLVNYGESVKSLRQLMRRMSLWAVEGVITTTTDPYYLWRKRFNRYPAYYGFDPLGVHFANGLVSALPERFNFVKNTPYNWFAPAFVGQRGSMHWTFNPVAVGTAAPFAFPHVRVYRDNQQSGNAGIVTATRTPAGSLSNLSSFYSLNADAGSGGHALTNQITNTGLSVQLPNYSRFRFQSTDPTQGTDLSNKDGMDIDAYVLEIDYRNSVSGTPLGSTRVWEYVGIGTDFGLYFFLNVPTMWIYSIYPFAG